MDLFEIKDGNRAHIGNPTTEEKIIEYPIWLGDGISGR